ncbi:site-specific integrase [Carboxylicivirga sp. N1Y90]|uniref:site-specific integrase n=1 Tax=Carboxylicivirga fragile TaxID=3417571 RepID=UPI003D335E6A|nr:site-specific integrase [Marinilabiliaceae bacterium N1Y90]
MRFYTNYVIKKTSVRKNGAVPICIRLTLNQSRAEVSTGITISPSSWDEVRQLIAEDNRDAEVYNNRLKKMISKLQDIYNRLVSVGDEFDIVDIKNEFIGEKRTKGILEVFDYYLKTIENNIGHGYAFSTLQHYRVSRKKLYQFMMSVFNRQDVKLSQIDYNFLNQLDMYLKTEFKVHQNTAWNYHKHLRRVLNLAISMNYISKNPYSNFKVKLLEPHRDFLTMGELKQIEIKNIELERLSIVRDVFVFACYTGLSFADVSKLKNDHIQIRDDGNTWIIINRTKTKSKCIIPLFTKALQIIKKYKEYPQSMLNGKVLPVSSNQKLNCYLKELAVICGVKKNLTMHMARHTFATTITLSNGVPIETVSRILGHNSLKVTQIYARVLENKVSEDMNVLKDKLGL